MVSRPLGRRPRRRVNVIRLLLAAGGVVSLLTAAAPADSKKAEEVKAMNGTWELVSGEVGGQKMPDAVVKTLTLVLDGERYTLKSPGPDDTGTVRLNPEKSPKELDVTGMDGPNKGKTFPAIYELGEDTLKVCYDLDGKKRPSEFKSAPGTRQFLAVYKRKKR
jgi:uncharacterized protein (TIGR03067 family)